MLASSRTFLFAFLSVFSCLGNTADNWKFIWIGSTPTGFQTDTGEAKVTANPKLTAELTGATGFRYSLIGTIAGRTFAGRFTALQSDFEINLPLKGSYATKRWPGMAESSGREVIVASDGFNVLMLTHEFP